MSQSFETPLGLKSGGQYWNISVVDDDSRRYGNLAFSPNDLSALQPVLEIDDETGAVGIGGAPRKDALLRVASDDKEVIDPSSLLIVRGGDRSEHEQNGVHIYNVYRGISVYAHDIFGIGGEFSGGTGAKFFHL